MAGRQLSGLDVAFLCLEGNTSPMHMGAVAVFQPSAPVDPDKLAALLAERADQVPRLRRRVGGTLFPPGGATWVEDTRFDAREHIHVHRLGEFDSEDPLTSCAAEWIEEPLDLRRPPWSVHVVTGLGDGRFALLLKLHHSFTDGAGAFAVAAGLLDKLPITQAILSAAEPAQDERSPLAMLKDGITSAVSGAGTGAGIASAVLRAARPYPTSPLSAPNSASRKLGFVRLDMADIRRIRAAHGGTANDVVLAVLTGALREWMINRGQRVEGRRLRALIPVSTRARDAVRAANQLSGYLCDLPVHLEDPVVRLHEIHRSMNRNKAAGPRTGAGAVPILAKQIPPPVHRLATRFAGQAAGLLFDTVITNVPLPKLELRLDEARLREVYPLVPLAPRHAVGVAATVYQDHVHIGLQMNGEAVADAGSLRDAVLKATAALYERSIST
ncbi:MAG TPA: wax ester/triacylglycerol synthase family O-acyltransferase [Amycolatopsis sp.]|uniref:wax ester/triacylglycerol synthase family O-acyltransferase n=1 Tax=Amycolatopsis sp. TaxID=37632 RepID=UPI002B466EB4|nr:wax ester/triacylglycerol synthase family O-acyltransferase [Amycolatopsis sp.]HKS48736.1 wax ester/triacylglycerol synthase family O-acyltransferase [Amycolatopsis sp.]